MADFSSGKRAEIGARLKELKPLVDEYERLDAAAAALEGISPPATPAAKGKRAAAKKPARKNGPGPGYRSTLVRRSRCQGRFSVTVLVSALSGGSGSLGPAAG